MVALTLIGAEVSVTTSVPLGNSIRLEAMRRCGACPVLGACGRYAEVAKPKWGIHAGRWCGPKNVIQPKQPGRPRKETS